MTRSEKMSIWLSEIINPIPITREYPKLVGTGIEFIEFQFKAGVTCYTWNVSPKLVMHNILKADRNKFIIPLEGKSAFTYRVVNGKSDSPILDGWFGKAHLDNTGYEINYNDFKFINRWIKLIQNKFVIE